MLPSRNIYARIISPDIGIPASQDSRTNAGNGWGGHKTAPPAPVRKVNDCLSHESSSWPVRPARCHQLAEESAVAISKHITKTGIGHTIPIDLFFDTRCATCPHIACPPLATCQVGAFGTVFVTPWLGSLSDQYGRRPFLMMLMFIYAVPSGEHNRDSSQLHEFSPETTCPNRRDEIGVGKKNV